MILKTTRKWMEPQIEAINYTHGRDCGENAAQPVVAVIEEDY
jgi:hypothetical protein